MGERSAVSQALKHVRHVGRHLVRPSALDGLDIRPSLKPDALRQSSRTPEGSQQHFGQKERLERYGEIFAPLAALRDWLPCTKSTLGLCGARPMINGLQRSLELIALVK